MKKIVLVTALTLFTASTSFGASIKNSKHDLGSGSTAAMKSTNQNQICVFCHTPHNATKNVPLWNRSAPDTASAAYKLYTSSSTLVEAKGNKSALHDDSLSIFCLSCHDGAYTAIASRVKITGLADNAAITLNGVDWTLKNGVKAADLGSDLTNDHPIGFTYPVAGTTALRPLTDIQHASRFNTDKSLFFKSNGGAKSNQMECSSCHKVHDNEHAPFLRTTNGSSTLCLSCHIK